MTEQREMKTWPEGAQFYSRKLYWQKDGHGNLYCWCTYNGREFGWYQQLSAPSFQNLLTADDYEIRPANTGDSHE